MEKCIREQGTEGESCVRKGERMVQANFELRPCQSQSWGSNHSITLLTIFSSFTIVGKQHDPIEEIIPKGRTEVIQVDWALNLCPSAHKSQYYHTQLSQLHKK